MMGPFYVDVDMVVENELVPIRNGGWKLPNEQCLWTLTGYGLKSKVINESGPGGGWPIVRLFGSRVRLERYLDEVYLDDGAYKAHIKRVERVN